MRSQTRYEWGKWKRKEVDELRVIEGKGQSVIKTHGKWRRNRVRREGKVIDCLVSPHAPVTELIGVAKTKRREVSVTSEPFRRAVRVRLRWDVPFSTSSLLLCNSAVRKTWKKEKYSFGGIQIWSCVQPEGVHCCFLLFFVISPTRPSQVVSSFKFSIKREQKHNHPHVFRYWFAYILNTYSRLRILRVYLMLRTT